MPLGTLHCNHKPLHSLHSHPDHHCNRHSDQDHRQGHHLADWDYFDHLVHTNPVYKTYRITKKLNHVDVAVETLSVNTLPLQKLA